MIKWAYTLNEGIASYTEQRRIEIYSFQCSQAMRRAWGAYEKLHVYKYHFQVTHDTFFCPFCGIRLDKPSLALIHGPVIWNFQHCLMEMHYT